MVTTRISGNKQRHSRGRSLDGSSENILSNKSHLLKEDARINQMRKHRRNVTDCSPTRPRTFHTPRAVTEDTESAYYTIYRDPSRPGTPNTNERMEYFDVRGKPIDPVDLLFEDRSQKQLTPAKILKKLSKSNKTSMPSIGAKELEYTNTSGSETMLNVMPSLTSMEPESPIFFERQINRSPGNSNNAYVDSVFQDLDYHQPSRAFKRRDEPLPEIPQEIKEEKTDEIQLQYFPIGSVWDCVTYLASFLPPIPVPEFASTETHNTQNEERTDEEKAFDYSKELPSVPSSAPRSRSLPKASSMDQLQSAPPIQRNSIANIKFNRKSHPRFGKLQNLYKTSSRKESYSEKQL